MEESLCKQKQQHYGIIYFFCGHSKQTNKQEHRKVCFCLPPALGVRKGCCPSAPRGGRELQGGTSTAFCKNHGACVAPVRPVDLQAPSSLVQVGSEASAVPVRLSAHLTQCTAASCCLQRLSHRMRLLQNKEKRLGQKDPSTVQFPATPSKGNPSFLSQKLFASVLFDSHYFINSINSYMGLLPILFAFQPG